MYNLYMREVSDNTNTCITYTSKWYLFFYFVRLFESESYSEAKEYIEKALRSNPGMVEAQDLLGQIEKAKSQPTVSV